jgi:hypothetical protein
MSGYRVPFRALGSYTNDPGQPVANTTGAMSTVDLSQTQTGVGFIPGSRCLNISAQFEITSGTPSGTFYIDSTNDPRMTDGTYFTNAVWEPAWAVAFTAGLSPAGPGGGQTAGTFIVAQNAAFAFRCRWVPTNGSQVGQGWATMFGVGALQS